MAKDLYPLLFEPVLKDYIWGGRNLEKLGRRLPGSGVIAESWEIAGHKDGTTRVANGRFQGMLLTELHEKFGLDLIGSRSAWAQDRGKFPLLIKLLDANRPLSVQVHPQDEYALRHEGNELGKSEMWVVLRADPGAEIILGLTEKVQPKKLRVAINNNTINKHLHKIKLSVGDFVCVPAGSLHAIMGGLLIAEIQQNSNTTYRVYDWGREGADGQPRPLHIDKALAVINFDQVKPAMCPPTQIATENGATRLLLCQTDYFVTERVEMAPRSTFTGNCSGETLEIWGIIEGEAAVNGMSLSAVQFILLPAAMGPFSIKTEQAATLLRTFVA